MPKLSVIMGVYNCNSYEQLRKSVDSILNQTFNDFEFIICNDGSNNETLNYLQEIEKLDERIKIISYEDNRGLNYALNQCIHISNGEYIARQDDDDISDINRLSEQVKFLDSNKEYSLVGTIANTIDDNRIWGEYIVPEKPEKKDFYWNSPFIHPTVVMRKEVLLELNGYKCEKVTRRCEDIDLFMRMYAKGYKGYNLQKKLYSYRLINHPKIKYRKMKYRIDEAIVRYRGYKEMGILMSGIPFIIKPILIGLIPQKILYEIKKRRY